MSTLREMVYFTLSHGDMGQDADEETGSDRIAALARSDPLGAALWRVLGSHDVHALRLAVRLLMKQRMMGQVDAILAIEEWLANVEPTDPEARSLLVAAEAVAGRDMAFQLGRRTSLKIKGYRGKP